MVWKFTLAKAAIPDLRVDGTACAAHLFLGDFRDSDHGAHDVLARNLSALDVTEDSWNGIQSGARKS